MRRRARPHFPHEIIGGIEHKHCPACDRWLPLVCYAGNRANRDGLSGYCRDCIAEHNKKTYKKRRIKTYGREAPIPAFHHICSWATRSSEPHKKSPQ